MHYLRIFAILTLALLASSKVFAENNVYQIGRNSGEDDWHTRKSFIVEYSAGILPTEIVAARESSDLILTITDGYSRQIIRDYFKVPINQRPTIRFTGGATWGREVVDCLVKLWPAELEKRTRCVDPATKILERKVYRFDRNSEHSAQFVEPGATIA